MKYILITIVACGIPFLLLLLYCIRLRRLLLSPSRRGPEISVSAPSNNIELLSRIAGELADIIVIIDMKGRFSFISPSCREQLGYDEADLLGKSCFEYLHPDDRGMVRALFAAGVAASATNRIEIRFAHANGTYRWFDSSANVICGDAGESEAIVVSSRDITEKKKTEQALRESEARYRTITENSSDVICELDSEARYIFISPNVESRLGYSAAEMIGKPIFEYAHGEDLPFLLKAWEEKRHQVVFRFRHKDGSWRWLDNTSRYFTDAREEPRIVTISRDITERKNAEEERWRNELQLRLRHMSLAELAKNDSLYRGDINASFRVISRTAARYLGVERAGVWLLDRVRERIDLIDLYCMSEDSHREGGSVLMGDLTDFLNDLEGGRFIDSEDAAGDPKVKKLFEKGLLSGKVDSILQVPIRLEGEIAGVISFEHVGNSRKWDLDEKNYASSLSDFASLAMESYNRRLAETALKISEEKLRERNAMMEKDLRNAQIIQRALLPDAVPNLSQLRIEFRNYSLDAVGGDYFSFTPLREGGLGVFIGDVSGHGVSAALFLSLLKATADRICRKYGQQPREFIQRLNNELIMNMPHYFITGIYGFFNFTGDLPATSFTFSKGGHPNPVMYSASTGEVKLLKCRGTILGKFDFAEYYDETVPVQKGDRIFLYTDGLPETRNGHNQIFGFAEIPSLIRRAHRDDLAETLEAVLAELNAFRGHVNLDDDVVIIGIEVL